ncbi:hypothetical protein T492DRAFT_1043878 [Pavlovales sp. CCMP2436]|nr:hypothetical protein T492DRAFT_1043878 [Pavlovales sp. CCMP2436]
MIAYGGRAQNPYAIEPWASRPGYTTVELVFNMRFVLANVDHGTFWSRQPGSAVPLELAQSGLDEALWLSFLRSVVFTGAHFKWVRGVYLLVVAVPVIILVIVIGASVLGYRAVVSQGQRFLFVLLILAVVVMGYTTVYAGWARAQDNCRAVRDLYEARFAVLGLRLTFNSSAGRSRGRAVRVAWFAIESNQGTAAAAVDPPPYSYSSAYAEGVIVGTPMPQSGPPPSYPLEPAVGVPVSATAVRVSAQPLHAPGALVVVVGTPLMQPGPAAPVR